MTLSVNTGALLASSGSRYPARLRVMEHFGKNDSVTLFQRYKVHSGYEMYDVRISQQETKLRSQIGETATDTVG